MEERRIPIGLFAIVRELKSWRLEYKQEVNGGVVTCWLSENPGIWGEGATIDAALQDMLSVMRECAEECFSRSAAWAEDFVLLMLKVLFSSDEELLSCLDGKTCGDS